MLSIFIYTLLLGATGGSDFKSNPRSQVAAGHKALQAGDSVRAEHAFLSAAKVDDIEAQIALADLYLAGGVAKNPKQAAYWYARASERSAEAQWKLGALYQRGLGAPQNSEVAVAMYRKAAQAGLAGAQNSLGNMYLLGLGVEQDIGKALELYLEAAAQHCADAQLNIATAYYFGVGMKRDLGSAREWAMKAKENGSAAAGTLLKEMGGPESTRQ